MIGGVKRGSVANDLFRCLRRARGLHAAFEAGGIEADACKPSLDGCHMGRFALMRRTGERKLSIREIEAVRGAGLD